MAITRWDPFREMNTLQQGLNRLFSDFGRGENELMTSGTFVPAVDIYEDQNHVTLKMEVPGVREEDLDVQLENNTLTVRGERKFEKDEKEENFHRIERRYGSFSRSFVLPNTVDGENVNASYDNGILTIRLAKRAEAKPRQIKLGSGSEKKEGKGRAA
jgi:HSP20 family protein